MVPAAKAATDFRQRTQRQRFGKIHGYLAWPHHVGGAPRRQQIAATHVVVTGDDALDLLDSHPFELHRTHQITQFAFGEFHRDRMPGELAVGEQSV